MSQILKTSRNWPGGDEKLGRMKARLAPYPVTYYLIWSMVRLVHGLLKAVRPGTFQFTRETRYIPITQGSPCRVL